MVEPTPAVDADETAVAGQSGEPLALELFAGYEMSSAETEDITLAWPTQLIVFAGAEGSGKTTMLAALYEQLGRAHSLASTSQDRSLLGFEKICHPNRVISGEHDRPLSERSR